jgi:hypothetical protein
VGTTNTLSQEGDSNRPVRSNEAGVYRKGLLLEELVYGPGYEEFGGRVGHSLVLGGHVSLSSRLDGAR